MQERGFPMRHSARIVMLLAALALAGCAARAALKSANSSQQSSNSAGMYDAPLSVPPGYNAPPLEAAASTPQQPLDPNDQSQAAPAQAAAPGTPGTQAFLQAAGASDVDPNIRAQIDAATRTNMDQNFVDQLVSGPNPPATSAGLQIQRRSPGMLDTIF